MPRTLAIDPRVPTSHGIIIRRHTLAEQTRAYITIKEARAYARRIIKEAQSHAEAIQEEAIQQGFNEGWQDSLQVIYASLRGTEQLHVKIEQALKQAVHDTLQKSLAEPGLELQLLEGWLATTPSVSDTLHLVLPRRAQPQVPTIIRRLEETLNITPTITMSENDHVVIECGDQLFEFSPTRTLDEIDELAKNCIRRLEIKKQYAAWSQQVVEHWLDDLAQRNNVTPADHAHTRSDVGDDDYYDDDDEDDDE